LVCYCKSYDKKKLNFVMCAFAVNLTVFPIFGWKQKKFENSYKLGTFFILNIYLVKIYNLYNKRYNR